MYSVPLPLKYTFKIILFYPSFLYQEKLDFAMNDIIFDLLSIGRTTRQISPEVYCTSLYIFMYLCRSSSPPFPVLYNL